MRISILGLLHLECKESTVNSSGNPSGSQPPAFRLTKSKQPLNDSGIWKPTCNVHVDDDMVLRRSVPQQPAAEVGRCNADVVPRAVRRHEHCASGGAGRAVAPGYKGQSTKLQCNGVSDDSSCAVGLHINVSL